MSLFLSKEKIMRLSNKIKKRRKELGISQEEAAEKLYISRQTLSNWENNKTLPDIDRLIDISNLYDLSLDELIKEDTSIKKKIIIKTKTDNLLISIGMFITCIGFFLPDSLSFFAMIIGLVLILFSQNISKFLSRFTIHTS